MLRRGTVGPYIAQGCRHGEIRNVWEDGHCLRDKHVSEVTHLCVGNYVTGVQCFGVIMTQAEGSSHDKNMWHNHNA